jgi:hypothetical protein
MGHAKEILTDDYLLHTPFVGTISERSGVARLINNASPERSGRGER